MSQKQTDLLDWLKEGVLHGIISEKKAYELYKAKYKSKTIMDFLEKLYSV